MTLRGCRIDQLARAESATLVKRQLATQEKTIATMSLITQTWTATTLVTGACPKNPKPRKGNKPGYHKWPRPSVALPKVLDQEKRCELCGTGRLRPKAFEASSSKQVAHLLYDLLKVPARYGKEGQITTDDEALSSIKENPVAWHKAKTGRLTRRHLDGLSDICEAILLHRDLEKQLQFLNAKLSPRGRFHASFNVAAAWTGRWSSSKDPFKRGSNFQNIGEQHRHIFVPDPGRKVGYADLKTAESLKVAYLAGDEAYIEAHKGDVHTWVCRELWPDLPWTGDIKQDKNIAASTYPEWDNVPGHDFRFQSKRIQHGTNFGLSPFGIARIARIPTEAATGAQSRYFRAFPMINEYQKWVAARVKDQLPLVNAMEREVKLFGRPWDDHTRKQGLAFAPQGGVGDVLNTGLWRVWNELDPWLVEILAQVHDAIFFQTPITLVDTAVPRVRELMRVVVNVEDFTGVQRECIIPVEIAIGDNWGKRNTDPKKGRLNPEGLVEV
jgi:DNA polymerase I-like protein with 3'-5' exonuclease and polymerase domains